MIRFKYALIDKRKPTVVVGLVIIEDIKSVRIV